MKLWIVILVVMIIIAAGGQWLEQSILKTTDRISQHLDAIKEAVRNDQWHVALRLHDQIDDTWVTQQESWSPLIHNHDLDAVTIHLARLKSFLESEERGLSLAEIAEMEIQFVQLYQQEVLTLKNVF